MRLPQMLAETALWPFSAESLTAWATAVLVIVTALGLGFTAVAARAAAVAAKIAADQFQLEAEPYIIVEEAASKAGGQPAPENSYGVFPARLECELRKRQQVGQRTLLDTWPGSSVGAGSPVPDAPAGCLSVKNIGRSPAIRLRLQVMMHYGPALGMLSVGYVEIASLAANERVQIWIYNLLDRDIDIFVQGAADDPHSPPLRAGDAPKDHRALRCASLAQITIKKDPHPDAVHFE